MTVLQAGTRRLTLAGVVLAAAMLSGDQAHAQPRDGLLNGALIGAAIGAGAGVAFTHAVRDSDLVFSQYARGALIFGAMGAGLGLGVDALLARVSPHPAATPPRVRVVPIVWRDGAGVVVRWRGGRVRRVGESAWPSRRPGRRLGQPPQLENAAIPVCARPRMSACTSCVPS